MKTSLCFLLITISLPITHTLFADSSSMPRQAAQQAAPPGTDIFVADLDAQRGRLKVSKPVNITKRPGYDNQPRFLPDGKSLFYTSIREDKQADIYTYDIGKGTGARLTETAESEYSPTVTPDGKYFSVIRVEADSTQRLWKIPLAGGKPDLVLKNIKPVGYHVWVDKNTVLLFVLGTPNTLQLVDVPTEKAETILTNVGRSLHRVPGQQKVSFVHKVSADEWVIKEMDIKSRKIDAITRTLPASEDYAWTPGRVLLMAKGSKLFSYDPARDKDWQEVADLSGDGVRAITRLTVSPGGNRIAFVANEAP
jgi:dipeptidyl aminopeptidase/acylaminoacyl peptidase